MTDPIWNPEAELVLLRRAGEVTAITVLAPVRGRPLRTTTFSREREPAIFDLLHAAATGAADVELDADRMEPLVDAGLLVPEDRVSRPVLFRSSLRDPPRDLVPRAARREVPAGVQVNPGLRFRESEVSPLSDGRAWAWVSHPDAAVPTPLSLDEADGAALRALTSGAAAPGELDPALREALVRADVLLDPEDAERRRATWAAECAEAANRMERQRYAVVRGILAPAAIAALRGYYRTLVAEGRVGLDDRQVLLRYAQHNEPLARHFHRELAGFASEIAGERVVPSYVFFASYLPGAVLKPHTDRAACEVSISLQIDYLPDPEGASPWPLYLDVGGRPVAVSLGLGDGLVYRGRELCHWRDALPAGHSSTSLFLHYVPADFTGALD